MDKILKKFRAKAKALAAAKKDARFAHVVGKLKRAKLLDAPEIPEYVGPVALDDVLWAGTIEPRILEILPALMATRPKFFRTYTVPDDLQQVVHDIHTEDSQLEFRGIPATDYRRWLPEGGTKVARLKTFRMHQEDIQRLKRLRAKLPARSDAEVLRRALSFLEQSIVVDKR